jgi:hypothetical protein
VAVDGRHGAERVAGSGGASADRAARHVAGPADRAAGHVAGPADRAARRALRGQIDRLEGELAALIVSARPRVAAAPVDAGPFAGPRVLGLGELERVRDALAARLADARAVVAAQTQRQAQARAELEAMYADPPAHRWRRLSNADLGLPGCTTYHVRPRLGPLGLLMDWWCVKVSSGCPLPSRP